MNKWQKNVLGNRAEADERILKRLKKTYQQAEKDIDYNIAALMGRTDAKNLQSITYQIEYQKALKSQISSILEGLNSNQFTDISQYLAESYEDGFVGVIYDLQGQGIPLIFPIDQEQVVRSLKNNSKLSKGLWGSLSHGNSKLQNNLRSEISRGFSQGHSYAQIARSISNQMDIGFNKVSRIVRTESHRISNEAAMDAMHKAKDVGADVVKQWDSTLDKRTRPHHAQLDGQIRELDEPFEIAGHTAMYPGGFGSASEDSHCRCAVLQRARWAVDDEDNSFTKWDGVNHELLNIKAKNYENFKKAYRNMVDKNQTLNDVTNRVLKKAAAAEPAITKDLQKIVGSTRGTINYEVKINGETKHALDFKLKGGGSLKRKITSDFVEGTDLDYIEGHIYDAVRYTDLVDGDFLVEDYMKIQTDLEAKGYKIVRVKNTLGDASKPYRGLNTVVEAPNGYKFELQFHTPESLDVKERAHVLYEEQRKDSTSAADKLRLDKEMRELSADLPNVKNIDSIKSYDNLKR